MSTSLSTNQSQPCLSNLILPNSVLSLVGPRLTVSATLFVAPRNGIRQKAAFPSVVISNPIFLVQMFPAVMNLLPRIPSSLTHLLMMMVFLVMVVAPCCNCIVVSRVSLLLVTPCIMRVRCQRLSRTSFVFMEPPVVYLVMVPKLLLAVKSRTFSVTSVWAITVLNLTSRTRIMLKDIFRT